MNRPHQVSGINPTSANDQAQPALLANVSSGRSSRDLAESRIASLKVLALTLLRQIESLERQVATDSVPELSLQSEVHRFEAALIRNALAKTGGRQRRAARLLGVKVTTLNTKIKRHKINLDLESTDSSQTH